MLSNDQLIYSEKSRHFLAPYACAPEHTHGRLHKEPSATERSCYQRDRDRIIHSTAFRRLEYKTQVFVYHEGDHYRNRLTHSLEVAQLTRDMCRHLHLEEDLGEAIALAHDLGHPPFGHAGEEALAESMQPYGGFDHNAQTIHILTQLEQKYAGFDGLNLSYETLEGLAKHNGPVTQPPRALLAYTEQQDLALDSWPSLEAQIAAIADDVAYVAHDLEDGMRADLLTFTDVRNLPLIGPILADIDAAYPQLETARNIYELRRRLIHLLVCDVNQHTQSQLRTQHITSLASVRQAKEAIACFSPPTQKAVEEIKAFLMQHLYRHYRINRMTKKAARIVQDLFTYFFEAPHCLPPQWYARTTPENKATTIADYIAGMTDRFASQLHMER